MRPHLTPRAWPPPAWALAFLLLAAPALSAAQPSAPTPAPTPTRLLFPVDGTAVSRETITLRGAASPGASPGISLNGAPVPGTARADGTFALPVRLAAGENALALGGKTLRVALIPKGAKPPAGFTLRTEHSPFTEECSGCHNLKTPGDFSLTSKGAALCLECHDDPTLGKEKVKLGVVHPPLEDGCSDCHDPHQGEPQEMLKKGQPALCEDCHDPMGGGKGKTHAPVAKGECTACHSPHASLYAKLVKARGQALCLKCHKDPTADPKDPQKNQPVIHAALDEGCLGCHQPHSSPFRGLLQKEQAGVCWECHDQGQVPEGKGKGIRVHSPIADDRECTACHRPHAGEFPKLLVKTVPLLCGECHDLPTVPPAGEKIHGPVLAGMCGNCHNPHQGPGSLMAKPGGAVCLVCHPQPLPQGGSVHSPVEDGDCASCHFAHKGPKKLLRKKVPALCADCHGDITKKSDGTPWAYLHPPAEEGSCLDCHRPHTSSAPMLLAQRGSALCLSCHDDPSVPPGGGMWRAGHAPVEKDCRPCHFGHGSDQKALLKGPVFSLCSGCHRAHPKHTLRAGGGVQGEGEEEGGRPGAMAVLPGNFPLTPEGRMNCTGCHLVHGGKNDSMLTKEKEKLCKDCH